MSYDEMRALLETVKKDISDISVARGYRDLKSITSDKVYEMVQEEETVPGGKKSISETLEDTLGDIKKQNEEDRNNGIIKGTLSDEQITELETFVQGITEAIKGAVELRENSDKDKIQGFVDKKNQEIDEKKKKTSDDLAIYSDVKKNVEPYYQDWKKSKDAKAYIEDIKKDVADIIYYLGKKENGATNTEKTKAGSTVALLAVNVKRNLNKPGVKDVLKDKGIKCEFLEKEPNSWKKSDFATKANGIMKLDTTKLSSSNTIKAFFDALVTVRHDDEGSPAYMALKRLVTDSSGNPEKAYEALKAKIKECKNDIQRFETEKTANSKYAEAIIKKAEIAEHEALTDEQFEQYAENNGMTAAIDADVEVVSATQSQNNASNVLTALQASSEKTIGSNETAQWKRKQLYSKKDKVLKKDLKRAQDDYVKRKGLGANREDITEAMIIAADNGKVTLADGSQVQLKYRGMKRYNIRSHIPLLFRGRWKKQLHQERIEDAQTKVDTANTELQSKKATAKEAFLNGLRTADTNSKTTSETTVGDYWKSYVKGKMEGR